MSGTEKKNTKGRSDQGTAEEIKSADSEMLRIMRSSTFRMKRRESHLVDLYRRRSQKTLVSVVMPTWNRAGVIKRAIDSVLDQSYTNFELIVSDDGSTDGTDDLIRSEYGTNGRIVYIRNEHRGVGFCRNAALERANGRWMAYLDTDNQWNENYLMVMVHSLEDQPDKSCAYCGLRVINEIRQARFTRLVAYDRGSLLERNYIDMNIFMHSKDLYRQHGGFSNELEPLEDWELILRYTRENPPLVVECCLANYYISGSINHQSIIREADPSYRKIRALHTD